MLAVPGQEFCDEIAQALVGWVVYDESAGGKCGGKWGAHLPKDCRGQRSKRKSGKDQTPEAKRAKAERIIKANQAILDNLDEE